MNAVEVVEFMGLQTCVVVRVREGEYVCVCQSVEMGGRNGLLMDLLLGSREEEITRMVGWEIMGETGSPLNCLEMRQAKCERPDPSFCPLPVRSTLIGGPFLTQTGH
jgi:hypothetical protein